MGRTLELKANGRSRTGTGFSIRPARFQFLRFEGVPYRGTIEAFVNPVGQPVLVNEVSLEDYLRGVVPNEIGPKAKVPREAFKAQAVAARTFTLANRGRYARLGFDVYSDQRSQVYGGVRTEHDLANQAIRETSGRIASFRDRPILALYSSTCGGVTANYGRIFLATPIEYLEGGVRCRDTSSPYHEWNEEIRVAEARGSLDLYAQVGALENVTAGRRDETGRIIEMTFEGTRGPRTLHGINLRRALGIRSNWITSLKPVKDSEGALRSLRLSGRGWGHGVGLCQFGAIDMARRGSDYRQILEHYYPGAKVSRAY